MKKGVDVTLSSEKFSLGATMDVCDGRMKGLREVNE
jgi:hypothetical protein